MRRVPEGGLVVLALAGLSLWMTWPIAAHLGTHVYDPGGLSRLVPGWVHPDLYLTNWIVGWVAHALSTAPSRLFAAPIFHPAPDALAYSEHLLGALPITLPAYWLGGVPFAHQTLLLMTFVLSALAAAALVGAWTRSAPAALVAGALYAFAPWRFHELHGVHLECAFYLPLVFLLAQRWLAAGHAADLVGLTLALTAQALAAYSLAYPTFAAAIPFVVVLALATRTPGRRLAAALGAIGVAAVLVAVVSLPYLRVAAADPAPVAVVATWSPEITQRTQAAWLGSYVDRGAAPYVGAVALVLAVAGLVAGLGGGHAAMAVATRPLVAGLLATTLALVLMSLGPYAEVLGCRPLAWLWNVVPGLRVFRIPHRFGFFVSLPVAALGGIATAALSRGLERRAGRAAAWVAGGVLTAAVCGQSAVAPVPLRPFPPETSAMAAYGWLATQQCTGDRCAVLEVPAGPTWDADAAAVFGSGAHGLPIVNGYSGFAPAAYPLVVSLAAQLPEERARLVLGRLTGTRWIVLHRGRLTAAERRAWDAASLPEAARLGEEVVYELPPPDADWRRDYLAPPGETTFAGTPLVPLPPGSAAALQLEDGLAVAPRGILRVETRVTNAGRATWPALTSRVRNRVSLTLTWMGEAGRVPMLPVTTVFLPGDLGPDESARVAARVPAPAAPGTYALEARVEQEGQGPLSGEARAVVRVTP